MLKKAQSWHASLTKTGKATVWLALLAFGFTGVAAANSNAPSSTTSVPRPSPKIQQKSEPHVEVKEVTETTPIPFEKTTREDSSLAKGKTQVANAGADGSKALVYKVTYTDGKETAKELVSETVTKAPVTEVTLIGTYVAPPEPPKPACDPNYRPCVPVVSYDLNCPDIGFRVTVIGNDIHGFDGNDNDGLGCESY